MNHLEFEAESSFIKAAYLRLEETKTQARTMMEDVLDIGKGGTHQARTERDMVVRSALSRLEQLEIGDQALCFGRIDLVGDEASEEGLSFHLGRVSVASKDQEPMIIDWRAPVAEPFYRATGKDPMGVVRRRHFECRGSELLGIEDEYLGASTFTDEGNPSEGESDDPVEISGAGALFAAIKRPRTSQMRDIVATIQGEQDRIIRHPMAGMLVVQGGPGTGKTAVALHRAAYLLYTHKWRFESQRILVVGPSSSFLRYIERVLPSLGETGVEMATLDSIAGYGPPKKVDPPEAAAIKGGIKMARVIAKGIRDRQRPLQRNFEVPFGAKYLVISPELSRDALLQARKKRQGHNAKRRTVELFLARSLAKSYLSDGPFVREPEADENIVSIAFHAEKLSATQLPGEEDPELIAEVMVSIRRSRAFQLVVERIWPKLSPTQFLGDLYSHEALFHLATNGILDKAEAEVVFAASKKAPNEPDPIWSREDLALLDEASSLLGPTEKGEEDPESFAHMVIDEAQDLSAMQARMLRRRCLSGSMTVLGDLAQAIGPSIRSWEHIAEHLNGNRPFKSFELSVNYRTPKEVMEPASLVLAKYAPELPSLKTLRASGYPVETTKVALDELVESAAKIAMGELHKVEPGTVGILAASALRGDIAKKIESYGDEATRVSIHDPESVKGLEFDSVVVVQPMKLLNDPERSLRALFVAMTRTTQRLHLLTSIDLPKWLVLGES